MKISRLFPAFRSIVFSSLCGLLLLSGAGAARAESPAPQPLVFFSFNEGSGLSAASTNSLQTAELGFSDASKGDVSLFGPSGSGLSGKPGDYALDIGQTTSAMGVAGGSGGIARLPTKDLVKGGLVSFTVTGWYKAASSLDGGARLVEFCDPPGNGFLLMTGKGCLVASLNKKQVSSPVKGGGFYHQVGTWVFFAVTYDGNKSEGNVVFYGGTPDLPPEVVASVDSAAGPIVEHNRHGWLSIGNNGGGIRPFHGELDNVAFFASSADSSAALTEEQIKAMYKASQEAPTGQVVKQAPKSAAVAPGAPRAAGSVLIALIGDSTVCNYPKDSPLRGWGQMLPEYLAPGVEILNEARGGLSSKTYPPAQWQKVLQARPDFVFIQFGHNDSHPAGRPESTDAQTDFKDNLRRYITEARGAGIAPVLVTPPRRRLFQDGRVTGELTPYQQAMKQVGEETHTPVIDLYEKSAVLFNSLGEAGSEPLTVNRAADPEKEDRTHFSQQGASELAKLISASFVEVDPRLAQTVRP